MPFEASPEALDEINRMLNCSLSPLFQAILRAAITAESWDGQFQAGMLHALRLLMIQLDGPEYFSDDDTCVAILVNASFCM